MPSDEESKKQASIPLDLAMFNTLDARATQLSSNLSTVVERLQCQMEQVRNFNGSPWWLMTINVTCHERMLAQCARAA